MAIPESVALFLDRFGFEYSTLRHAPGYTAEAEAHAAHVPPHAWAKTVVYIAGSMPVVAVLPADRRVVPDRLREVASVPAIRQATEEEITRMFPRFEAGAIPPLGPMLGQRVFVDPETAQQAEITFCGGTHTDAIRMRYGDFAEVVHPSVGRFAG
jgi:Ala-tRNA(Pro) deacylase